MKLVNTVKLTGVLLAGLFLSLFSANSFALTASGTTISNLATVNYSVGSTAQTPIGSSSTGNTSGAGTATTFLVDDKLVLSIIANDGADVTVQPGQTSAVLSFTVTNNGNATQGVTFTTVNEASTTAATAPFTGTDNFDTTSVNVFVANGHGGAYVSGTDTASSIPQLAAGATAVVYIVATIPAAQLDGDIAIMALKAQIAAAGASATYGTAPGANITTDNSGSAWTPGTVQNIFADAAGSDDSAKDGIISIRDVFKVLSAKLTVTKTVSVISDPTGDATPHAIPGAVVQYTITVANASTASSAATGISIADTVPANTTYVLSSVKVTDPNANGGAQITCADTGTTVGEATCGLVGGNPAVSGVHLNANQTLTMIFQATVN